MEVSGNWPDPGGDRGSFVCLAQSRKIRLDICTPRLVGAQIESTEGNLRFVGGTPLQGWARKRPTLSIRYQVLNLSALKC